MLDASREIIERAIAEYSPYAIVSMISGGKDSLAAYLVAKEVAAPISHLLHGVTGTGIAETTQFVRNFAQGEKPLYIEANAGTSYVDYVQRKGFFGRGVRAHSYAYHLLKEKHFRRTLSQYIRQRKRNRPILLLNGARTSESANRARNLSDTIRNDHGNIWVNVCHDWTQEQRDDFLTRVNAPVNPVTEKLCRSGECLCLHPDTLINTPKGYRRIADIVTGEEVYNLENGAISTRPVAKVHHNSERQMYRVHPFYLLSTQATENHPFLVRPFRFRREPTTVSRIIEDAQYISVGEMKAILDSNHPTLTYKKHGFYLGLPFQTTEIGIGLTEEQLKLIGYFMAEGAYNWRKDKNRNKASGIIFTVSEKSRAMADDIQRCMEVGLGVRVHRREWIDKRNGRALITIRSMGLAASDFIGQYIDGRYCHEKFFRPEIVTARLDEQAIILAAMWIGDGADYSMLRKGSTQERVRIYSTSSRILALQVQEMLLRAGSIYGIRQYPARNKHSTVVMYQVCCNVDQRQQEGFIEDGVLWARLRKITEGEVAPTCNLTIEDEPNFITEGGLVHNCGTSQSQATREEVSFYFPEWGRWLDELERPVKARFGWGWGQETPSWVTQEKAGQMRLFRPMCVDCIDEEAA